MGLVIILAAGLVYWVYKDDDVTPHYHNWIVGYTGALINFGQDPISKIAAMLFYGVFVEEAVDYGILDVFVEDDGY